MIRCDSRHDVPIELEPTETALVTDGFMNKPNVFQPVISGPLIRIDDGVGLHVGLNDLLKCFLFRFGRTKKRHFFDLSFRD